MKVLITGAYGLLGKKVVQQFLLDNGFEVFGIVREEVLYNNLLTVQYFVVELTDTVALQKILIYIKPEIIIHCAANVNLTDCEKNKHYAYQLHVNSSAVLSQSLGLKKFIYISTDSVFDGEKGGYLENEAVNPLNNYAKTKWEGEIAVLNNFEETIVVRTNIYGNNNPIKNSLAEWAFQNLSNDISIDGFTDVIFNPVSTVQLAKALKVISVSQFRGIINVVSNKPTSKYYFLLEMARKLKKNENLVHPVSILKHNSEIIRPLNTSLSGDKLKKIFGLDFSLEEGLDEIIKDLIAT